MSYCSFRRRGPYPEATEICLRLPLVPSIIDYTWGHRRPIGAVAPFQALLKITVGEEK